MKQFKPKMYPAVAIREADLLLAATVPKPRMNDFSAQVSEYISPGSKRLAAIRLQLSGFTVSPPFYPVHK